MLLVVEDDEAVREKAVDVLRAEGFDVMEAADGDAALTILQSYNQAICLLFTDVNMPGKVNGLVLANRATQSWPWVAILVASSGDFSHSVAMPTKAQFLAKPYDRKQLVGKVRDMLSK